MKKPPAKKKLNEKEQQEVHAATHLITMLAAALPMPNQAKAWGLLMGAVSFLKVHCDQDTQDDAVAYFNEVMEQSIEELEKETNRILEQIKNGDNKQ